MAAEHFEDATGLVTDVPIDPSRGVLLNLLGQTPDVVTRCARAASRAGKEKRARTALNRAQDKEKTRDQARRWLRRLDAREEGFVQ